VTDGNFMSQGVHRWKNSIRVASQTDVGLRRANNQDSHAVVLAASSQLLKKRGHLFVVADGMGAHAAGELASQIAVEVIPLSYSKRVAEPIPESLRSAVYDAHHQIRTQGNADEAFHDMGTTVDALVISTSGAFVAHVGDSRVYRLRNRIYEQLTFDHSLVWEIRASGKLPGDKVPTFIPKNVITRSLGPSDNLKVDLEGPFPLKPGDCFLLCSDGLSGQVEDAEMGQILSVLPPEQSAEILVNLANLRGGPDNITVIIAQILAPIELTPGTDIPDHGTSHSAIPLIAWICLGFAMLSLLISGYSLVSQQNYYPATIISALITLVFGTVFVALSSRSGLHGQNEEAEMFEQPFGNGPYVRADATPRFDFVKKLAEIIAQLRDAAQGELWDIVWHEVDVHEQQGSASARNQEFSQAVYHYSLAINHLMSEIKRQKKKS
jgi:protein phosphatase